MGMALTSGPVPRAKWPNGLELSCPAEAGNASRTVGHEGGQDKNPRTPRPPGQLQRVVRRQRLEVKADQNETRSEVAEDLFRAHDP